MSILRDEHAVVAGRNTDTHLRIDLQRRKTLFQPAQQCKLFRRVARPRVCAVKPFFHAGNTQALSNDHRLCIPGRLQRRRQCFRGDMLDFRPGAGNNGLALLLVANNRDSRVGVHFIMECVRIVHLDDDIHRVSRCHQRT